MNLSEMLGQAYEEVKTHKVGKLERLEFRVRSAVTDGYDYLTEWEKDFISGLNARRINGSLANISAKQEGILLKIWTDLHAKGHVQLPKGMF
ncbi:MAG: hypothetical protein E6R03_04415 [Hyphomicrobiaceae bacterium]|nr:MAG: hypothetical protein E6R03_04415 [Hyphomicrobiaceae bacterium]